MKTLTLILALTVLFGCENEEVAPSEKSESNTTATNHVVISFNGYSVGDSININDATLHITRLSDSLYYPCNLSNNLTGIRTINDCEDGYLELYGTEPIIINYKGDLTIDYL